MLDTMKFIITLLAIAIAIAIASYIFYTATKYSYVCQLVALMFILCIVSFSQALVCVVTSSIAS